MPIEIAEGRNLGAYKTLILIEDISEHVVFFFKERGKKTKNFYKDFFGGYYHDSQFGFWTLGTLMKKCPDKKLWLWSMAGSGGIWEDLLTDSDGRIWNFQAGRLLNQYSPEEPILFSPKLILKP